MFEKLLLVKEQMFQLKVNNHHGRGLLTMNDSVYDDGFPMMKKSILNNNIQKKNIEKFNMCYHVHRNLIVVVELMM
jgi:hypothetical protein